MYMEDGFACTATVTLEEKVKEANDRYPYPGMDSGDEQ